MRLRYSGTFNIGRKAICFRVYRKGVSVGANDNCVMLSCAEAVVPVFPPGRDIGVNEDRKIERKGLVTSVYIRRKTRWMLIAEFQEQDD